MNSSKIELAGLESKIYLIRGEKVMLDHDLAELYQVTKKRLREQVKRNQKRFPEDFTSDASVTNCDIKHWSGWT